MALRQVARKVSEMIVPFWAGPLSIGGLRSRWDTKQTKFWPTNSVAMEGSRVDYNQARALYRNGGSNALGAGFCKPMIDLAVGFMGLPTATSDDPDFDDFLNSSMHDYWPDELQQVFRDAMRDSKVYVRVRRPSLNDPLMILEDAEHCEIECIAPERVQLDRSPKNKNVIERAIISHKITVITDPGSIREQRDPTVEEHEAIEVITRNSIQWWDRTTDTLLDWGGPNPLKFVPIVEVVNEYESYLQGGVSDLETSQVFIAALATLIEQGLTAHKYHSIPKVKFKIKDVQAFITNNFPEAVDPQTGKIKAQSEISWTGKEIVFIQPDEDADFIEAQSVLGDTTTLAEFLIDCICVSSQTPEWAFMRVTTGTANPDRNAQTVPFTKKILRKRQMFTKPVQDILKMVMVINGRLPRRTTITWDFVRADDQLILMQALQMLIMGLEVAKQSGEISDTTYREMIRPFMPFMKNPEQEEKDAEDNKPAAIAEPLPQDPSQNGNSNGSSNGKTKVPLAAGPQGRNE
jgi:hypothetical protein